MRTSTLQDNQRKSSLTPQMIAECGVQLAQQTPVSDITIRQIAQALNVTPMAIYRHYPDKNAMLEAMLDCFILQADVIPDAELDWQEWLYALGMNMYRALCDSPSWIPLFGRLQLKPGALAVLQSYWTKMLEAGFAPEQAARGFFALLQSLVGAATLQQAFRQSGIKIQSVESSLHSMLMAVQGEGMENGLRLLIDGLARELKYKIVWKSRQ